MSDADDYLRHSWALAPHVCARCFARVLVRPGDAGANEVYRCSNCGFERAGADESAICSCGLPGVRCQINDNPTPMDPGEIVAVALT